MRVEVEMSTRCLVSVSAFVAIVSVASLFPTPLVAQQAKPSAAAKTWNVKTPDGQIDLEGVWDFSTITPLERPNELAGRDTFSNDEEAAAFEREENRRQNRDLIDPKKGSAQYLPGSVIPYNEFWFERGSKVVGSKRTSLIVEPADGRIPTLTPVAQARVDAVAAAARDEQLGTVKADSAEERSLVDRCILGLNAGPPMTPGAYNNHVQILQTVGYVALITEMVHDVRVIPMDGRPNLPANLRQYKGDSRGRWEGRTLVVETTNYRRETSLRGSSAKTHLVERFTRLDADTLLYEFRVDDPTTWTRPWAASVPMNRISEPIFEYACHEGNYAMPNILSGARAQDRELAAQQAGK
jgi:hypothetical protein